MHVFDLEVEQRWDAAKHVERVLGVQDDGDFTVACWEPGQISPYHCHPYATEIYFCVSGGGRMYTPRTQIDITVGTFCVHPKGELHEYVNGAERTKLFRVRYGDDLASVNIGWRGHPERAPTEADIAYFKEFPPGITFNPAGISC